MDFVHTDDLLSKRGVCRCSWTALEPELLCVKTALGESLCAYKGQQGVEVSLAARRRHGVLVLRPRRAQKAAAGGECSSPIALF